MPRLSRGLLVVASLLLFAMYATPLWRIHLIAPQYPEGLGMLIRLNTVTGEKEHDLNSINSLNHYIGMKPIDANAIPEMRFMPWIVLALALGGLTAAAAGRRRGITLWLAVFGLVGVAGLADMWRWGYDYGHNLAPDAIIQVPGMTYQPPLIGSKQLLNFRATSWPASGGIIAGVSFLLGLAALLSWRPGRPTVTAESGARALAATTIAFLLGCGPPHAGPFDHSGHGAPAGAVAERVPTADSRLPNGPGAVGRESGAASVIDVRADGPVRSLTQALALVAPGGTIRVHPGTYREPTIVVRKPVVIQGVDYPTFTGGGPHTILVIAANDVTVRGLRFDSVSASMIEDPSAIRVVDASGCRIEDNRVNDAFFGIYLARATDCRITGNTVRGNRATEAVNGNGIHLWSSRGVAIGNNHVSGHRDGIYFEFVHDTRITGNRSEGNIRYGLHFMYSDDCSYEDNQFIGNGSGVAVMYTKRVVMTGNRFEDNWGPAAYGLLLKEIGESRLERNVFMHNTTGLLADGADRLVAEGNTFRDNGWAVKLEASTTDAFFSKNEFLGNSFDVATNSREHSTRIEGNYWDDYRGYDLNRDGVGDVPFHPVRLFSMVVERHEPALILMRSLFTGMLDAAERVLPALTPETLVDARPLMRRPT
jgi:nitrous oxidase accessory protein